MGVASTRHTISSPGLTRPSGTIAGSPERLVAGSEACHGEKGNKVECHRYCGSGRLLRSCRSVKWSVTVIFLYGVSTILR